MTTYAVVFLFIISMIFLVMLVAFVGLAIFGQLVFMEVQRNMTKDGKGFRDYGNEPTDDDKNKD